VRSEPSARRALLAFAFALALAACSSGKSFIVLSLEPDLPTVVIQGVETIVVQVSQAPTLSKTLTYDAGGITIGQGHKNDLSVSFTAAQSGVVTLDVRALDAKGCLIGLGRTSAIIRRSNVAMAAVKLSAANDCTVADGGVPSGDAIFPGCDPVAPVCPGIKTCQVNCTSHMGECVDGGVGPPGASCVTNADCKAGSQCFDYASLGCKVKLCLRFCNDEAPCAQAVGPNGGAGDGGVSSIGTRSKCTGPVQCGSLVTAYHTCTFGCDPRQSAIAAQATNCPTGLSCLVVGAMDEVDCACAEKTRTGIDGAPCTSGAQCAPGYICNLMGGTQKCRAVCRCEANGMTCTAPNDCTAGKACTALTNDTIFGVCI
jgi:hypothetical protein